MAEDDIYGNKRNYERLKQKIPFLHIPPEKRPLELRKRRPGRYYCKNKDNVTYFLRLIQHLEAKDVSYLTRIRILNDLLYLCFHTIKNIKEFTRDDINNIMIKMHDNYKSPKSKQDFIKHTKQTWKILFPEKDKKGRIDETITPYAVRHLSGKIDRSREKMRKDKLAIQEIDQIINYFSNNARIQAYITLALESLARPQEILYLKIGNIELHDNYAKIWITEHGKEGTGLLQCIDSYPYLLKWLDQHPQKQNPQAYLFVNTGQRNTLKQLRPENVGKILKKALKDLNINKPVTCYSLKRNGVTIRRLRGESDMEIQHAARWKSTEQLKTYDLSNQTEALQIQLQKRGLLPADKQQEHLTQKKCAFCNTPAGSTDIICPQCKRPLDRKLVLKEKQKDEEIQQLRQTVIDFKQQFTSIKEQIMQELTQEILKKQSYDLKESELRGNLSSKSSSKTAVKDLPLANSPLRAL